MTMAMQVPDSSINNRKTLNLTYHLIHSFVYIEPMLWKPHKPNANTGKNLQYTPKSNHCQTIFKLSKWLNARCYTLTHYKEEKKMSAQYVSWHCIIFVKCWLKKIRSIFYLWLNKIYNDEFAWCCRNERKWWQPNSHCIKYPHTLTMAHTQKHTRTHDINDLI